MRIRFNSRELKSPEVGSGSSQTDNQQIGRDMRVKVADYDINRENRIDGLTGYDAVEILIRDGRYPVGWARISCEGDSLDPAKLRDLAEKPPKISKLDAPDVAQPNISIAICTRNRSGDLAGALRSLVDQVHAPHEILVIDNGCQSLVRDLVAEILPNARYVPERNPGLSASRNRALTEASGDAIAFMDDDAEADPYWVKSIAQCLASFPKAAGVVGLTVPLELETASQQLFEANCGYARGFERRVFPRYQLYRYGLKLPLIAVAAEIGTGCNMAFRCEHLKKFYGFDEFLGPGPLQTGGGDDIDIFYRLMRAGYDIIYEPGAIVRHRHRPDKKQLLSQLQGHQRGFTSYLVKSILTERGPARAQATFFLIWRLAKAILRTFTRLAGQGKLPLEYTVRTALACYIGLGSYQASRWRRQRRTHLFGGKMPSLVSQFIELWCYRELIWNMCGRDLKVKYQRSWLGFLWTVFNPLVMITVLVAVFSQVIRIPIDHYWAFLISGYFTWNLFAQTINGGVQAAVGNAYLTRSTYFPQEVLILSSSIARLLEYLGELCVVMLLLAIFHHKGIPGSFIMAPLLVAILFIFSVGIAFPLVTLAVYFNDTIQVIPLATTILFYLSPVFYNLDLVPEAFRPIYILNPMANMLNMFHDALYLGKMPHFSTFLVMTGVAVLCGLFGYMLFNRKKREFAEIV